jgi:hypothetical protein
VLHNLLTSKGMTLHRFNHHGVARGVLIVGIVVDIRKYLDHAGAGTKTGANKKTASVSASQDVLLYAQYICST